MISHGKEQLPHLADESFLDFPPQQKQPEIFPAIYEPMPI